MRVALLEADVNFKVVKGFIERGRVKAVGQGVLTSLTPGQDDPRPHLRCRRDPQVLDVPLDFPGTVRPGDRGRLC